ncbi:MAG: DUF4105 domain-containing protein [Gammaproteobacteria bacterium]|nr:DUF4105 domain-containing protein [Gammaproteobacteria bacterium]
MKYRSSLIQKLLRSIMLLVLLPLSASAAYVDELIAAAHSKQLSAAPEWHALLHYYPNLVLPGVHSLADDPAFLNAPDGKTNPEAELDATLRRFFEPPVNPLENPESQHAQCTFIARYHWLRQQLNFDDTQLIPQSCARFEQWFASLNPAGVTLIFPAAYLNNPASMFGHTLLRVDAKDQTEKTRLLAYAVNYAAVVDEKDNGVTFAVNGLIGGYAGMFSVMPYYLKVREYSEMENRDIWEYRLNFTEPEIEQMLRHLWELRGIRFDYYFFDENCSYHLLSLFEVARPELELTREFRWWAIPADTIRSVVEQKDLVGDAVYRPAGITELKHQLQFVDDDRQRMTQALANRALDVNSQEFKGLTVAEQAKTLEFTHAYLNYDIAKGHRTDTEAGPLLFELYAARSKVDTGPAFSPVPTPAVRPEQGHATARLALGLGYQDQWYQQLRVRPAYHDLLDPQAGYEEGAQIDFLDFSFRHWNSGPTRLESWVPVSIVSLVPRNRFIKPVSWKIRTAFERKRLHDGSEPLLFTVEGGAGLTQQRNVAQRIYAMIEGGLAAHDRLDKHVSLGLGPSVGMLWQVNPLWRLEAGAKVLRYGVGEHQTRHQLRLEQNVVITNDSAIRVNLSQQQEYERVWSTAEIAWQHYF